MESKFKDTFNAEYIAAVILALLGSIVLVGTDSYPGILISMVMFSTSILLSQFGYITNQNKYIIKQLEILKEKNHGIELNQ